MKKILLFFAMAALASTSLRAQTATDSIIDTQIEQTVEMQGVIADIVNSYKPWYNAEFNGKLLIYKLKLPVTPTVKIYMERDSLLQISVRAPLIGEVGRLEFSPQELLIVNKMKKLYVREDPAKLLERFPTAISELQSIFLARVIVLGRGELSAANHTKVQVEELENGNTALVPDLGELSPLGRYGYIVGPTGRTLDMLAIISEKLSVEIAYTYLNGGMQMNFTLDKSADGKTRKETAELDFSSVKWGGSRMSGLKLGGYEKVGLKDFFKRLK